MAYRARESSPRVVLVTEVGGRPRALLAGDRFERLELNALVQRVIVTDERRRAAEELARTWTALSADEILASPYALIGTVDEMVEDLEARRRRWNISYILTHEPYLEAFAPVVARLTGR